MRFSLNELLFGYLWGQNLRYPPLILPDVTWVEQWQSLLDVSSSRKLGEVA